MTLHATRSGQSITVNGNTGVDVEVRASRLHQVRITENAQHVRFFHTQLGELLDAADAERAEAAAAREEAGAD
jgi:hypothetical protein